MVDSQDIPEALSRYSRQIRFPEIGVDGQQKLSKSKALLVGCGALGSMIAATLCRAGVGTLRIVDRDFLEVSNLQRQFLFSEKDVASGLPKAIAAKQRLGEINRNINIEAHVDSPSGFATTVLPDNVNPFQRSNSRRIFPSGSLYSRLSRSPVEP